MDALVSLGLVGFGIVITIIYNKLFKSKVDTFISSEEAALLTLYRKDKESVKKALSGLLK